MSIGVSIVVCCHNSARLLPDTLAHLANQRISDEIHCEVIIVDNASTDSTSALAQQLWPGDCHIPMRIVNEPRLGLIYARCRGVIEAKYEFVSFIDDDNWVNSDWSLIAAEVMSQQPLVGACGGDNDAVCEVDPPYWFEKFKSNYAVGVQGNSAGDITNTRGYLWGAGLTVRKSAWLQLTGEGCKFLLVGRQGKSLTAGEDTEICMALRLAGWHLWYEPRLKLSHFLPAHRLNWRYLRLLIRGQGAASVGFDPYEIALNGSNNDSGKSIKRTWLWHTLATVKYLLRHPVKLLKSVQFSLESDPDVLDIECQWGRLIELLRKRRTYNLTVRELREMRAKPHGDLPPLNGS